MIITATAPSLPFMLIRLLEKLSPGRRLSQEAVHTGLALERFFHGRLRSSCQMLRQAIITSKTANAIAVANAAMIVPNERTYITPC
jgi:hypothetical protein